MRRPITLIILFIIAIIPDTLVSQEEGFPWGEWVQTTLTSTATLLLPPLAGEISSVALGLNCENYTGVVQFKLAAMEFETLEKMASDFDNPDLEARLELIRCLRETLLPACQGDEAARARLRDCVKRIRVRMSGIASTPPTSTPPQPEGGKDEPPTGEGGVGEIPQPPGGEAGAGGEPQAPQQPEGGTVPGDEDVKKLREHTQRVEDCLKECEELKEKLEELKKQLQDNLGRQQDLRNQIEKATADYSNQFDKCKVLVFEDRRNGNVYTGARGSGGPDLREAGWLIPPDCQAKLNNIRKGIAKMQEQLAGLQGQADALQKQMADLEAQLAECLKNCEELKNRCLTTAGALRESMQHRIVSSAAIEALAAYDSTADWIRKICKDGSYEVFEREKAWIQTEIIGLELHSSSPLPWGIIINGNTDWVRLGFQAQDPMLKASGAFSGGLYVPSSATSAEGEKTEVLHRKPTQPEEIPRSIRLIAPSSTASGERLTLAVTDGSGAFLSGAVVATDSGEMYRSDEHGRIIIPSLTVEADFISFYAPGTDSFPLTVRIVRLRPPVLEKDAPLRIESAPDIVQAATACEVHGAGFDGLAENTEISIAGRTIVPIAESVISMKFEIPKDIAPGSYTVAIREKGRKQAEIPILCIRLSLTADKLELKKGESTKGRITIVGTDKPLSVEITNYTPLSVSVDRKIVEVKNGMAEFEIRGIQTGTFSIGTGAIKLKTANQK
ncbi:MAG: hypothetical protein AB1756_07570 [Acidobacteriota bacterium]